LRHLCPPAMGDSAKQPLLGPRGLPEVSQKEVAQESAKMLKMLVAMLTVPRVVGIGSAFLVLTFGASGLYRVKLGKIAENDLGYLYLSAFVMSALVQWLNVYPMLFKQKLLIKGNMRANMCFFKMCVAGPATGKPTPYVVMEEEGVVGEYNRANRSMFHFNENLGGVLLNLLLAGFVFPLPAFVCVVVFALGRVLHQVGYASGGYGKHAPGFMLTMLAMFCLEGMVLIAALGAFGVL